MQPPEPPVPLKATYSTVRNLLTVTFNKLLQTQAPIATNRWNGCMGNRNRDTVTWSALLRDVTATMNQINPFGCDPQILNYLGPPPILRGRNGLAVAPFAGFPVTNIH